MLFRNFATHRLRHVSSLLPSDFDVKSVIQSLKHLISPNQNEEVVLFSFSSVSTIGWSVVTNLSVRLVYICRRLKLALCSYGIMSSIVEDSLSQWVFGYRNSYRHEFLHLLPFSKLLELLLLLCTESKTIP